MINAKKLHDIAIEMGIKHDPRGKKGVARVLKENNEAYKKLDKKKQKYFDKELLTNPYADSRFLAGDEKKKIKKVLAGVDCTIGELLLGKELGVDAVIAHHPEGRGLLDLDKMMEVQIDEFAGMGVPVNLAEKSTLTRMDEIKKAVHASNAFRNVDAAKVLGMTYMNFHTAADNCVDDFIKKHLAKKKPERLQDVIEALLEIPEFEEAAKRGDGPEIFVGNAKSRAGKIFVSMTGGTGPGEDIWKKAADAGVGTVVEMHFGKPSIEKAKKLGLNVICSGHMASDSVGMNMVLDELEREGVEIVPVSGLIRVSRVKKRK